MTTPRVVNVKSIDEPTRPRRDAISLGSRPVGASLRKLHPPPEPDETAMVRFVFNPERISLSHTYTNTSITATSIEDLIKSLGFLEIGISKVYLIGPSTQSDANTLIEWSYPVPVVNAAGENEKKVEPIDLQFGWGAELSWQVRLRSVNIAYTRFDGDSGKPIRAEVGLGMYSSLAADLPHGNPTSGGPAGRSGHVLDSSECLASLAAAKYDRPGAWRIIARANAIDDPLRVAPGTAIYVPEPGELGNGAGGRP